VGRLWTRQTRKIAPWTPALQLHAAGCSTVTGGSSGIGIETARGLAMGGAAVTLAVRRPEVGESVVADIQTSTGNACRPPAGLEQWLRGYHRIVELRAGRGHARPSACVDSTRGKAFVGECPVRSIKGLDVRSPALLHDRHGSIPTIISCPSDAPTWRLAHAVDDSS
jgi:hypothetical protein